MKSQNPGTDLSKNDYESGGGEMKAHRLPFVGAALALVGLVHCALCPLALAQNVNFVVREPAFLIKQPMPNACWATAAAMLQSWKAQALLSIDKVVDSAGPTYSLLYQGDSGLSRKDNAGFLRALHLHAEPPATYSAQALESKLRLW